jgi:predicted AAA+ superfamily ATPase
MLFLVVPSQVRKTTISKQLARLSENSADVNRDGEDNQHLLVKGTQDLLVEKKSLKNILVLDEDYKFKNWRNYVKGLYDKHHEHVAVIVTGSGQFDGDSLMERYLLYKVQLLSFDGLGTIELCDEEIKSPIKPENDALDHLIKFGGFPVPFLKGSDKFHLQ